MKTVIADPAIQDKVKELKALAAKYGVETEVSWRMYSADVAYMRVTRHGNAAIMMSQISFTDTGKIRITSYWREGTRTETVAAKHIEESLQHLAERNEITRQRFGVSA